MACCPPVTQSRRSTKKTDPVDVNPESGQMHHLHLEVSGLKNFEVCRDFALVAACHPSNNESISR